MEEKEGLDVDVEISGAFSNQLSPFPPHHPLETMIIFMKMLTNSSILILKTPFQFDDEKIWIFTKKKEINPGAGKHLFGKLVRKIPRSRRQSVSTFPN